MCFKCKDVLPRLFDLTDRCQYIDVILVCPCTYIFLPRQLYYGRASPKVEKSLLYEKPMTFRFYGLTVDNSGDTTQNTFESRSVGFLNCIVFVSCQEWNLGPPHQAPVELTVMPTYI